MLLQTPPSWEKAEDIGLIKSELVAILFALAAILFAAAFVLNWLHDKEQKKKEKATQSTMEFNDNTKSINT